MAAAVEGISRSAGNDVFSAGWWLEPFGVDLLDIIKRLPTIIPASELVDRNAAIGGRAIFDPATCEKGFILTWPDQSAGFASLITVPPGGEMEWLGGWPFVNDGVEHQVAIEEVLVDARALEGVVRGSIGSMPLDWHDPFFALDRDHYGPGSIHRVALGGFAHSLRFGAPPPAVVRESDPSYAVLKQMNPEGARADGAIEIRMEGMAALLPVGDIIAFYEFQGPVTAVTRRDELFLGRIVWRLTVTVARLEELLNQATDIVVLVSDVVLNGREPPQVGDDVGGRLRLQGVIALPKRQREDVI